METKIIDNATMMAGISELIGEGRTVVLRVKGNSMNPFFATMRDNMVLSPWKSEDLRKGAVVLGRDTRGHFLIHRIYKVEQTPEGKVLTLLGDGNLYQMETVLEKEVIALVTGYERKGRKGRMEDGPEGRASFQWRLYSFLWRVLTPVRRWPLGLWRHTHKSLVH